MKQLPLPLQTRPAPGFGDFVPGPNALAVDLLRAWRPGAAAPAPFYLWGAAGCGKTHLLRALAGAARAGGTAVAWFTPADPVPWAAAEVPGLVVFDTCDRFDAAQQHAAFTLFVETAGQGVQVAAAGRLPPVDLPLREDLRTRLAWGHVLALHPLGEADTRLALRQAAHARGLTLADEVSSYLLARFERDMGHLMAQLDRLDAFALAHQRAITLPMLRQMLAEASVPT